AILRDQIDSAADRIARRLDAHRLIIQTKSSGQRLLDSEYRLSKLRASCSDESGQPQDLAAANRERNLNRRIPARAQVLCFKTNHAVGDRSAVVESLQVRSYHQPDHTVVTHLSALQLACVWAVAQTHHSARQGFDLTDAMLK